MRDLAISITVDTSEAEAALARVEERMQGIERAAAPVASAIDTVEDKIRKSELSFKRQDEAAANSAQSLSAMALRIVGGPTALAGALAFGARKAIDMADSIDDMSRKSKIGTDAIQTLGFVAEKHGKSFDTVANAASELGRRLSSGLPAAVKAMQSLGLSVDDLLKMKPEDRFRAVGIAIAGINDPAKESELAFDAMGRGGRELLGVFDDLADGAEDNLPKMSDAFVRAGAASADAIDLIVAHVKTLLAELALLPVVAAQYLTDFVSEVRKTVSDSIPLFQGMFKVTGPGGLMAFRQQMMGGGFSAGAPATPGFAGGIYGPDIPPGFVDPVSPRTAPRSRVLPFTGYQTMDTDYLNWLIRARGPQMMAIPGHGIGTFPGWDLPAGWEGNSNVLGPFDTSPLTPPPGVSSPGFFSRLFGGGSGMGGRLINSGLGMLSGLIPGMSGKGASFGSLAGSFLGPLGSIGGGLIGGLFGKLFGGGEGGKTRDARNDFISNFGGLGALQAAAGSAGFNLDKLLNTKKMAEFESEVRKLEEAMGAFDQKVQDANDELDNMESTLDATVKKGEALGYEFDRTGELVSVSFEKMQETASKYGISLDALGPAFQKQRLHEMAGEIINDFELLNLGGTDTGTILAGMSPKIEELVQQSIKFGVEIPKNMQPWIENLIQAGELTDENGVAITDLTQIKFGEPIATEFEKIQGSLKDLIEKIGELVDKITEMGRGVDNATRDRTINIGFNVQDPPDIPTPDYNSLGGFVKNPRYLSGGGWIPRGTDTVPAMLTPGEGVMTRQAVSRLMRGDWPQGGGALTLNVNVEAGDRDDREFGERISREVIRGLKRRGVRLNAA